MIRREGRDSSAQPASEELTALVAGLEPGRKGEILGAAAGVFAERGYEGGSMRDIAVRVGVTEPALYRHFPGKEALFLALMRVAAGRVRDEATGLVDAMHPEGLRSQLIAAFADRRRAVRFYGPVLRTVLSAASHNPTFLEEFRRLIVDPMRQRLAEKASELDVAFAVTDADATRQSRVRALMALFVGYFASSLVLGDEPDEAIADAVLRVMGWDKPPAL